MRYRNSLHLYKRKDSTVFTRTTVKIVLNHEKNVLNKFPKLIDKPKMFSSVFVHETYGKFSVHSSSKRFFFYFSQSVENDVDF